MPELSPSAQAVLDAYRSSHLSINNLAAALRAAGKQFYYDWNGMCCEEHLKAIAAELEAQ